ncbi:MAG: putative PEP-binding protein, partial [Candidatus Dormiibacterota bacterium]
GAAKPTLEVGICGEHGGDAQSIAICERLGLDYVSCSPFRVPGARLAAAQARLRLGANSGKRAVRRPAPAPARSRKARAAR